MCRIDTNKGSVTLEAAFCVPVLIAVFLFMYGILEMFLLYNCISKAMYETADLASSYSVLYHENGIAKLEKTLQDKLSAYVDTSLLLSYGDNLLYQEAAEKIFTHKLEQDAVYQRFFAGRVQSDFSHSEFFDQSSEITLKGSFQCDYAIPFVNSLLKGFSFHKTLRFQAFTEGTTMEFDDSEQETESVWSLSNFERGKRLQEKYGRNLPQFFPTIDYYQSGTAGMIRSINHTLKTYQDTKTLEKVLNGLYEDLVAFDGGTYGGTAVKGDRISRREIILIFPEDDFTDGQQTVVDRFVNSCQGKGVMVTVERYQRTDQSKN